MLYATNYTLTVTKNGCTGLNTPVSVIAGQNTFVGDVLMTCTGVTIPPPSTTNGGVGLFVALGAGAVAIAILSGLKRKR